MSCVRQVWLPFHCGYSFPSLVPNCCEMTFDKVASFSLHVLTIAKETANHMLVECIRGTTSPCYNFYLSYSVVVYAYQHYLRYLLSFSFGRANL